MIVQSRCFGFTCPAIQSDLLRHMAPGTSGATCVLVASDAPVHGWRHRSFYAILPSMSWLLHHPCTTPHHGQAPLHALLQPDLGLALVVLLPLG